MELDDNVCLCFHVTKRKLQNYLRIESLSRASQLAECGGAGTGCGWCVPFLQRLFEEAQDGEAATLPTSEDYVEGRKSHISSGKGTPPS